MGEGALNHFGSNLSDRQSDWSTLTPEYFRLISDKKGDSAYLRDQGLKPTLIQLIGEFDGPVLDAGCGNRWLFDHLKPSTGAECDIVEQEEIAGRPFFREDLRSLRFEDDSFALVVSSLSLMWIAELRDACSEIYRVTEKGGRFVVALIHPYFYRTGDINKDGAFTVTRNLSGPFVTNVRIAEKLDPIPYHYRSVSDYFSTFTSTGWTVTAMREWFVDLDHYKEILGSPRPECPRTDKVPMFLFFECLKGVE